MRPLKNLSEIVVIGGGLAGLSAARHAARLGRLVTLFEASGFFGGLVATIDEVDGLPVPGKFSGQDLAIHLLQDARKAAVRVIDRSVAKIEFGTRLTLIDDADSSYHPEAIIVASGASLRKLGIPGEQELVGKNFAGHGLTNELLAQDEGTTTTRDYDGTKRILGFIRVPWTNARLAVGVDETVVHSGIDREITIAYTQLACSACSYC